MQPQQNPPNSLPGSLLLNSASEAAQTPQEPRSFSLVKSPLPSGQKSKSSYFLFSFSEKVPRLNINEENASQDPINPFSGPNYFPPTYNKGKVSPLFVTPTKGLENPFSEFTGGSKDYPPFGR